MLDPPGLLLRDRQVEVGDRAARVDLDRFAEAALRVLELLEFELRDALPPIQSAHGRVVRDPVLVDRQRLVMKTKAQIQVPELVVRRAARVAVRDLHVRLGLDRLGERRHRVRVPLEQDLAAAHPKPGLREVRVGLGRDGELLDRLVVLVRQRQRAPQLVMELCVLGRALDRVAIRLDRLVVLVRLLMIEQAQKVCGVCIRLVLRDGLAQMANGVRHAARLARVQPLVHRTDRQRPVLAASYERHQPRAHHHHSRSHPRPPSLVNAHESPGKKTSPPG